MTDLSMDKCVSDGNDVVAFLLPLANKITVYSKSKCDNCSKVKMLLEDHVDTESISADSYVIINCDNYLQSDRSKFIAHMSKLTGRNSLQFPLVFAHGQFVGGFKETVKYIHKIAKSFITDDDF